PGPVLAWAIAAPAARSARGRGRLAPPRREGQASSRAIRSLACAARPRRANGDRVPILGLHMCLHPLPSLLPSPLSSPSPSRQHATRGRHGLRHCLSTGSHVSSAPLESQRGRAITSSTPAWRRKQLPELELQCVLMLKHISSSFPSYEMHTSSSNRSIACTPFFHRIKTSCSSTAYQFLSAALATFMFFSPLTRSNNSRARPQLLPPSNQQQ
ncbi:unnamed protein product, partial [Urochloa humidicola]